uniref:Uncharacterized protein n=1 Tax=Spironucleus salmonicida TaxID=348837 RepID=V6LMV6_9EUKA|eukprot:EST45553.1 Hypothetical protein SS50377_14518 [Spironucleus salmonicida]
MRLPLIVQDEAREFLKYYYSLRSISKPKLLAQSLYEYSLLHPEVFELVSFKSQYNAERIKKWCYVNSNLKLLIEGDTDETNKTSE